jgi:D-cysteine desulfhydrase family pyridoxal phosphate-dependent enzyme
VAIDASALERFPRITLGHWPTPLERCDRLRETLGGPHVWIKRDDCTGLGGGGNKTRKLEYLLGQALAEGADSIVTFGALQSNHARQTAAACARLGLRCDLVLTRAVARDDDHYLHSGNVLLDQLFGATIHMAGDADAATERYRQIAEAASTEGRRVFAIPAGGSNAIGLLGYVRATLELAAQAHEQGFTIDRVVVAASTAGTTAGIVLGAAIARLDLVVDAVCVYKDAATTDAEIRRLVMEGAVRLGCPAPDAQRWTVTDAFFGRGYGVPTPEMLRAVTLFARTEGLLLDPVYTGKAAAALIDWIERGKMAQDQNVVFVHTGGAPGLFAYTPALTS